MKINKKNRHGFTNNLTMYGSGTIRLTRIDMGITQELTINATAILPIPDLNNYEIDISLDKARFSERKREKQRGKTEN